MTHSTESVMTSRLTSEARMPSWPMLMPSLTVMVPNSIGKPPRGAHAVLGVLGQLAQGHVARGDLVPRGRDGHLRLHPVVVGHADRTEHRAGCGLLHAVGDVAAAGLHIDRGSCFLGHVSKLPAFLSCHRVRE